MGGGFEAAVPRRVAAGPGATGRRVRVLGGRAADGHHPMPAGLERVAVGRFWSGSPRPRPARKPICRWDGPC